MKIFNATCIKRSGNRIPIPFSCDSPFAWQQKEKQPIWLSGEIRLKQAYGLMGSTQIESRLHSKRPRITYRRPSKKIHFSMVSLMREYAKLAMVSSAPNSLATIILI